MSKYFCAKVAMVEPDLKVDFASWRPTGTKEQAAKKKNFSKWIPISHLQPILLTFSFGLFYP